MGMLTPPIVLSLAPLDPSGRGGIQADIESCASLGVYCSPIATALCASGDVETANIVPVQTSLIIEQSRGILEDMPVSALRIGYTGSVNNAEAIHTMIKDYPSLPVVYQPSLNLWEADSDEKDLPVALSSLLLPAAKVAVLSLEEAQILTETSDNINATAEELLLKEPEFALISHPDSAQKCFHHSLYNEHGLVATYDWPFNKIHPDDFGPSSTFSSALSAFIAHGSPVKPAIEEAFRFTQQSLNAAKQLSFGKTMPNRLFWAESKQKESATN